MNGGRTKFSPALSQGTNLILQSLSSVIWDASYQMIRFWPRQNFWP